MNARVLAAVTVVFMAGACAKKDSSPSENKEPSTPPAQADDGSATAKPAAAKPTAAVRDHMKEHFAAVSGIKDAIVVGDLDTAKRVAAEIVAGEVPEELEEWKYHFGEMQASASVLASADDLQTAAMSAAELAGECASCHRVMTAIATFEWSPQPEPTEGDIKSHMAIHKWATDRLWEGLVGPSPGHWRDGATLLAEQALHPGEIDPSTKVPEEVAALAQQVHELGKEAIELKETGAQIALYGKLLGTCSACHGLTRK